MKYMRRTAGYTLDRLQNKCTHWKGIRNNTGSGQTAGIQEELDTTCKQNDRMTEMQTWNKKGRKINTERKKEEQESKENKKEGEKT